MNPADIAARVRAALDDEQRKADRGLTCGQVHPQQDANCIGGHPDRDALRRVAGIRRILDELAPVFAIQERVGPNGMGVLATAILEALAEACGVAAEPDAEAAAS